jgi:hypothetical protein
MSELDLERAGASMVGVVDRTAYVFRLLEEHEEDHPNGFTKTELTQLRADLSLRELRKAIDRIEAAGGIRWLAAGPGTYRIALPRAQEEETAVTVSKAKSFGVTHRPHTSQLERGDN